MDEQLERETEDLKKSWLRHDEGMLREYLVAGVEDPHLNLQSILSRHRLLAALFEDRFEPLMEQELRFATVLNWAGTLLEQAGSHDDLAAVRHALEIGAADAEGILVPRFVAANWAALPCVCCGLTIPNYVEEILGQDIDQTPEPRLPASLLSTFETLWSACLTNLTASRISVLEVACGSANDYRCLHASGLSRLIDYAGIDLCEKNVTNARALFPDARFVVGNALQLQFPNRSFDYTIVQDLFEHLSPHALEAAIAEVCRVTRRGLTLGFFSMHEGDEHQIRPVDDYHWNCLSLPRLRELLARHGFEPRIVHIDTLLRWRFGDAGTHNKNAYTLFAERKAPSL